MGPRWGVWETLARVWAEEMEEVRKSCYILEAKVV